MSKPPRPHPLTLAEFFERDYPGGSMADAARGTGLSYQTVHALRHGAVPRPENASAFQSWSLTVAAARRVGAYISAARTLGCTEPAADEFAR